MKIGIFFCLRSLNVIKAFKENGVQFWLESGSLLGAFRNGHMIPHDFDLDVAVFGEDDLHKAGDLLKAIKPEGYIVRDGCCGVVAVVYGGDGCCGVVAVVEWWSLCRYGCCEVVVVV
ncbi:hypothetical protein QZH41_003041 [Actinostola sp. cb2023]|nr:hypothetical protein QZH41_003041 [Actinostola sp. cb2023]